MKVWKHLSVLQRNIEMRNLFLGHFLNFELLGIIVNLQA